MSKYNFYYDESEHSRKINHNTITADNYFDTFIAVVVGWNSDNETEIKKRYLEFETKYQCRQSKGELKSTTIKQTQLKNGFASLNPDNLNLLEDFLELFDAKVQIYYSVVSKIEHIIKQIFEDYENSLFFDMDAMKYSITKAIIVYKPKEIIAGLYDNTDELVGLLRKFFNAQIEKDKENESLKQLEIEQFRQILMVLDGVSKIRKIEWNYDFSFIGFRKYLAEKAISNYSLTIDKEGEEGEKSNTYIAAERVGLSLISEEDSLTFFGLRMADMLAGLISKMLKNLHNALHNTSMEGQVRKQILDKSWFIVSEQQLNLYKKLHNVLIELNYAWYKSFAGLFSDDLIVLIAFLNFMNHFQSAESIKVQLEMQGEYFNAYACDCLSEYYQRMQHKLPLDPIEITSEDYYVNQRGAKVFFDMAKQPLLKVENGSINCNVLSVGVSQDMIPMVTIEEGNDKKCYQIPSDLLEWALTLVGLSNRGINLFPSRVIFSKTKAGYNADIL